MFRFCISILLIGFLFLAGCNNSKRLSSSNLSHIYKKNVNVLHPDFTVYHNSDSTSEVYFRLPTYELLFIRNGTDKEFTGRVKIAYERFDAYESSEFIDSSSVTISTPRTNNKEADIIGHFTIKADYGRKYVLKIITTDLNKSQFTNSYLNIDKSNRLGRQNFKVTDIEKQLPIFVNNLPENRPVRIECNADIQLLHGRYYNRSFPIAPAPFALHNPKPFNYEADSLFEVSVNDSGFCNLSLNKKGFYHLLVDSTSRTGLTLFNFGSGFPRTGTPEELLAPLRYLTSRKEFDEMTAMENPKKAVDKFWLNSANNPERAKELIRNFYNRVQDANRYFSSYAEGWKTDRGMIYIVFGAPNVIYKTSNTETWIYGEENNYMSLNINFIRVENPFSDNDYRLNRSPIYKNSWYRQVDTWRQGRILTIE